MPPAGKRKGGGEKAKPKGDASDATTDDVRAPPPSVLPKVRHTESEASSTEVDESEGKRPKLGSPLLKRAAGKTAVAAVKEVGVFTIPAVPVAVEVEDEVEVISEGVEAKRASRRRRKVGGGPTEVGKGVGVRVGVDDLKAVSGDLAEVVMAEGVDRVVAKRVLECSARYESLLFKVMLENEYLRGCIDSGGKTVMAAPSSLSICAPKAVAVPAVAHAPTPKPVETWSVVVRGKTGTSAKEVIEKVEKEVGPTLGVRVHELRPMKDGGAVIRTPSVAEREKVAKNAKFGEVGLEVQVKDKLGPRVVVQRVHPEIGPDEFMAELYAMNLKAKMSQDVFKKSVRLVTAPWKATGGPVNVVLEGTSDAMQALLGTGRVYAKWFSFPIREHDAVPCCHRCLGFDHMVRECRMQQEVCRRCGTAGHVASRCTNDIRCKNCAFKGLPSGHLMTSLACPVYGAIVARAKARH